MESRARLIEKIVKTKAKILRLEDRKAQFVDSRHYPPDFEDNENQLKNELAELEDQLNRMSPSFSLLSFCPYKGLLSFQEEDAEFFFGRESEITQLHAIILRQPLTFVIGPSGSGKSSLIFAGLIPKLRSEDEWFIVKTRPGNKPFYRLAEALIPLLQPEGSEQDNLSEMRKLANRLQNADEIQLGDILQRLLTKNPRQHTALLVIDQFEELLSPQIDVSVRESFLDILIDTLKYQLDNGNQIKCLITLRADFLGKLLKESPLSFTEILNKYQDFKLVSMSRKNMYEVINSPVKLMQLMGESIAFEESLEKQILNDIAPVERQPLIGNLPLLEFALTKLWGQQSNNTLTLDAYERMGRVSGAIAKHAETVFANLDLDEKKIMPSVMAQLVYSSKNPEDKGTRRLAYRTDVGEEGWILLQKLAGSNNRLVVIDRDEISTQETAEIIHESLIHHWERFQDWIAENLAFREWQDRLRVLVEQWNKNPKDHGPLLRGNLLAEAIKWLNEPDRLISDQERNFIQASIRANEDQRRITFLSWIGLVLLIIALGASAIAISKTVKAGDERDSRATSEALAISARGTSDANANLAATQAAEAENASNQAAIEATIAFEARSTAIAAADIAATAQSEAVYERDEASRFAQLSQSRELAAAALSNLSTNPELCMLLALESAYLTYQTEQILTAETEIALHQCVQTTQLQLTLPAQQHWINSVVFSPDGEHLLTASQDGNVKIWDSHTGEAILALPTNEHNGAVNKAIFNSMGTRIGTASPDWTARIWNADSGAPLLLLPGHRNAVNDITFNADDTLIATASGDLTAKVWDAESGSLLFTLSGHTGYVNSVSFNHDSTQLITSGGDNKAIIWDIQTQTSILILSGHSEAVTHAIFSPNGSIVATASNDDTVKLWDLSDGQEILTFVGHNDDVRRIQFSPDGTRLATASLDGTARIWDIDSGQLLAVLSGHSGSVNDISFSPDGNRLATASDDRTIKIWDISQALSYVGDHVAVSARGDLMVTSSSSGAVRIWDVHSDQIRNSIHRYKTIIDITLSPDGKWLGIVYSDNSVEVFDTDTLSLQYAWVMYPNMVSALEFDTDSKLLGVSLVTENDEGMVRFFDVANGLETPLSIKSREIINDIAFNPQEELLATAGDNGDIYIWDLLDGKQVRQISPNVLNNAVSSVQVLLFTPDGNMLASANENGDISLWDIATGLKINDFIGHSGTVHSLAFNLDGSRLYSGGFDQVVRVWDSASGQILAKLPGHDSRIVDIEYNPFQNRLISSSGNTIKVFILDVGELIQLAESRVIRSLTPEECQLYLHGDGDECPIH